jgi:hypothetical protein
VAVATRIPDSVAWLIERISFPHRSLCL